jgi:hypothetical protein
MHINRQIMIGQLLNIRILISAKKELKHKKH